MEFGTVVLYLAIFAGIIDIIILTLRTRISRYESASLLMAAAGWIFSVVALFWMTFLIFSNDFRYDYVYFTTDTGSDLMLKISAIWAGQAGSMVFWTMLSFTFYLGFRVFMRKHMNDKMVRRASLIAILMTVLLIMNTVATDPFKMSETVFRADGLGLNPLLRTFWSLIHPPVVFIGYALTLIPFSVKLAGFTVESEVRNRNTFPVMGSYVRLTTVLAWIMLSIGLTVGGYWAYLVLGWGGYWSWDPVETTSLVPWLLITAYYHAKAVLRENDVLRDSFLVFTYVSVLFASWVTRSGVLSTVHGFSESIASWTMLVILLSTFIFAVTISAVAGYTGLEEEDDNESFSFSITNVSNFSIKVALAGICIIAAFSLVGVILPAAINVRLTILEPLGLDENMVAVGAQFFRTGFYVGSALLISSSYFCITNNSISNWAKGSILIILYVVGGILGVLTLTNGILAFPTSFWLANSLIPLTIGAILYLSVTLIRFVTRKKHERFSRRRFGRLVLHLGLVILLLGVFYSENVSYETSLSYELGESRVIAPGISIRVEDIEIEYYLNDNDYSMIVTFEITEAGTAVGTGSARIEGHPIWQLMTHGIFVHSNGLRDVFIAVSGFTTLAPDVYVMTIHTKVLPLISFVWIGAFLMVAALVPMGLHELSTLRRVLKTGKEYSYGL